MELSFSICIPTFNRANYLNELLESISVSSIGFEKKIEIVISNNASTDNTEDVINSFKNKFSYFQYHSHKTPIMPVDNHFKFVAGMAKSDYIWLMGDDDKILPNSIGIILESLQSQADLYIPDFMLVSKDMHEIYCKHFHKIKKNRTFRKKNELLSKFGPVLSLISSVIFKKEMLNSVNDKEYLKCSQWGMAFLFFVYSTLQERCHVELINRTIFAYRCSNSNIDDYGKIFVIGIAETLNFFHGYGYSKNAIKKAKEICIKKYVIREILSRKARGSDCSSIIDGLTKYYRTTNLYWLVCKPIMMFSPDFLSKIRFFYQRYIK